MAINDTIKRDEESGQITIDLKGNQKQRAFIASDKIRKSFTGGRGSGKSVAGAIDFCIRCKPGGRYFIIGPSYTMLQGTMDTFREVATCFGLWNDNNFWATKPPRCTLNNGAEVYFRSGDEPKYLKGGDKAGAWLDEAQDADEAVYWMTEPCLRQWSQLGWMSATFTPGDPDHWTSKTFISPTNPDDVFFIRSSLSENQFAPPGQYEKLKQAWAASPARIRRELEGECIYITGAEWLPDYFDNIEFKEWPPITRGSIKVLSLDSSLGKEGKGDDYAAYIKCLWQDDLLYLDADMRPRQDASIICQTGIELYADWNPDFFVVEEEMGMNLLIAEMHRIADERNMVMGITPMSTDKINKLVRIRRLTPYVSRKQFRFKSKSPGAKILREQMMAFPVGKFDDGPDALEYAVRMLVKATTGKVLMPRQVSFNPMGQGA